MVASILTHAFSFKFDLPSAHALMVTSKNIFIFQVKRITYILYS